LRLPALPWEKAANFKVSLAEMPVKQISHGKTDWLVQITSCKNQIKWLDYIQITTK
jgi:hypothetical protein